LSWKEESFDFVGREVKKSKEDGAWTAIRIKRKRKGEEKRREDDAWTAIEKKRENEKEKKINKRAEQKVKRFHRV